MEKKQLQLIVRYLTLASLAVLLVITTSCSCGTKAATTTGTAAVFANGSTTKSAATAGTTTQYTNPEYVIKVLPQWKVSGANPKDITVNSPTDPNTYVRVITAVSSVTSLDSYLSSCVSLFKREFPTYAEQSRSKITVNGVPAYSLDITFTKAAVPLKGKMYVVVKGTQGYVAVAMATPANWNKYSSDLIAILNSLKPN